MPRIITWNLESLPKRIAILLRGKWDITEFTSIAHLLVTFMKEILKYFKFLSAESSRVSFLPSVPFLRCKDDEKGESQVDQLCVRWSEARAREMEIKVTAKFRGNVIRPNRNTTDYFSSNFLPARLENNILPFFSAVSIRCRMQTQLSLFTSQNSPMINILLIGCQVVFQNMLINHHSLSVSISFSQFLPSPIILHNN